ncbi:MAG: pyridoxal-phosphate dependent enzyme [Streptosporangiales bacterium]|nr:pyridoxal-phosphate dependent enzyme [Streptosporangiales bacterium]
MTSCDELTDALTTVEVEQAHDRIRQHVRRTPVVAVERDDGTPVSLKLEYLQHTGTFKARGATNRLLAAAESGELTDAGVVAASGGNAGLAVAYGAGRIGASAEIYVPEVISKVKADRLRGYGAEVVVGGASYADALAAAKARIAATGAVEVHAYDQREVCAGQGTLALELLEQAEFDTVLVAAGGGGLIAGITAGLAGRADVVAVEPANLPTLHAAFAAGGPVDIEVDTTAVAADSLGARRAGTIAYATTSATNVASVLVTDDAIVEARRHLWASCRIVVEHSGAAALAALRSGAYRPAAGERVAVVCCGANTDPSDL